MSLPAEFFDELRTRASIAQVAGRKVSWDQKKTNINRGDYWAPCPFHQEKTASFHVDDKKGFYYCFGCQAKGDALSFIRETENVNFMEAVEILARECGMTVPAQNPKAVEISKKRDSLSEIVEEANIFYQNQLKSETGQIAQSYINKRQLKKEWQIMFEIGFAPNNANQLEKYLSAKNISVEKMIEAGLVAKSDDGKKTYDRFRNRIIFPIKDIRGKTIAFGGRALGPNAPAKYINSPESSLFDKGRTLYNLKNARNNLKKDNHLIVAEGYMDVIALTAAGFNAAVAPLGTAITESQLRMMWRLTDEPVIALDGDQAGISAAMRAIDLALPLLTIGKSLRFAVLPQGQDPDDIIKSDGKERMKEIILNAVPMIDLLWQRALEGQNLDSPDRRAAFDASLKHITKKILEPTIRNHYFAALKAKRSDLLRTTGITRSNIFTKNKKNTFATIGAKSSTLATKSSDEKTVKSVRDVVIFAILFTHPELMKEFSYRLERMELQNKNYLELRNNILQNIDKKPEQIIDLLNTKFSKLIKDILNNPYVKISPALQKNNQKTMAIKILKEEFTKLETSEGMKKEIRDAIEDLNSAASESLTWRLGQATDARSKAQRSTLGEAQEAGEDKGAMTDFLQNLIDNEAWIKKNK
jgi:DNA primase